MHTPNHHNSCLMFPVWRRAVYLHNVGVVHLPFPDGCSVTAVFKQWCVVVDVQQGDGDPAVGRLQPVVSQHHQLDLRTHLEVQRVVFLHTDLT